MPLNSDQNLYDGEWHSYSVCISCGDQNCRIMNGIHPMVMNQLPYPMIATRSGAMRSRDKFWLMFKQGLR